VTTTLAAALADRYRIERELGHGGMATVYLAEDLRHHRRVAVKVLRPELAAVIGGERFLAEIRTTANLQHPHILPLFDSGEADSFLYYVMPYVEGESLRDRLTREKQLPIPEAVRIAVEVCSALDYAHRHGIVHRDIKPENILLHDGQALIADFGIALAASKAGGSRMTETGMSLGTPHYMSPEQAMGEREITARSDVYAAGCVLYEMLIGEPPFTGPTAQAVVAKVVTEKPASLIARRDRIPSEVEEAVLTALEKLPADRFASAAEFASALTSPGKAGSARTTVLSPGARVGSRPSSRVSPFLAAIIGAGAAAALLATWQSLRARPAPVAPVTRVAIALPDWQEPLNQTIAVSPDGSGFLYSAGASTNDYRLYFERFDQLGGTPLPGTDNAACPTFSPDGRSLAFTSGSTKGELQTVPLAGGQVTTLVSDSSATWCASWGYDGFIYYASAGGLVRRVPAAGGPVEILLRPDSARGDRILRFPEALPNGRAVLFAADPPGGMEIRALRLADRKVTRVGPGLAARYFGDGYLAMVQTDGQVMVSRFDLDHLTLTGPSVPLLGRVQVLGFKNGPVFAVSPSGTVLYEQLSAAHEGTPVWVDRSGLTHDVEKGWAGPYDNPALSPDGSRIAVVVESEAGRDIWIKQIGGPLSRLTLTGENVRPVWSPDGRSVLFALENGGLFSMPADGSAPRKPILESRRQLFEGLWSADAKWFIYREGGGGGDSRDIFARRTEGDTTRVPLLTAPADEYAPALSPDGRWLAYTTDESGRTEVFVRPFPEVTAARLQVSTAGGTEPVWSHSGRELFYRSRDHKIMAALISVTPSVSVRSQQALFDDRPYKREAFGIHADYAVSPDDKRFLMIRHEASENSPLVLVLNWVDEVRARLGASR
jgi:serine/threonine-protein kinase